MIAQKIIRGKNFFINKINNKFFSKRFSRFFNSELLYNQINLHLNYFLKFVQSKYC